MAIPHSKFIVGITGGIGSGKSAATRIFESLGVEVVDADVIAREVVEPGTAALKHIADHFGKDILQEDGGLDRKALRERIFSDPGERQWLESLTHPLIRKRIEHRLETARSAYVLLSSPLLLETGQSVLTDRVLIIDVPESLQIERTVSRDQASAESVEAIIASQIARSERQTRADDIIVNDRDLDHLADRVRALHEHYCRLAAEKNHLKK